MAKELSVQHVYVVVSKLHRVDPSSIISELPDLKVIGLLPYQVEAVFADLHGVTLFEACPDPVTEAASMLDKVMHDCLRR